MPAHTHSALSSASTCCATRTCVIKWPSNAVPSPRWSRTSWPSRPRVSASSSGPRRSPLRGSSSQRATVSRWRAISTTRTRTSTSRSSSCCFRLGRRVSWRRQSRRRASPPLAGLPLRSRPLRSPRHRVAGAARHLTARSSQPCGAPTSYVTLSTPRGTGLAICADRANVRCVSVRRGAVSAAAALLIGSASLGCSSSADKAAGLPSASGTPTPSAPAFPKTREGAAAFVEHFYDVYDGALANADLIPQFRQLSLPSCHSCANIVGFLERAHANGASVEGGKLAVAAAVAPPFDGDVAVVTTVLNQSAGRVIDSGGKQVIPIPKVTRDNDELQLRWRGTVWAVSKITSFGSE